MRILPEDLTPAWHARLILLRCKTWDARRGDIHPGSTAFERAVCGTDGMEPEHVETALPAARRMTVWLAALPWLMVGWLPVTMAALGLSGEVAAGTALATTVASGGLTGLLSYVLPRLSFRSVNKRPIDTVEIAALLELTNDDTERDFLNLLRDVIRHRVPPAAEEKVRSAIRSLGDAIERLPVIQVERADTDALRAEAAVLREQAAAETDRLTAESLERRARAILQRADANDQSALVAKRTGALRAEISSQVDALKEGLAALQTEAPAAAGLTELAEAAGIVATEAVRLGAARQEVEAVSAWPAAVPAPAVQTLHLAGGDRRE